MDEALTASHTNQSRSRARIEWDQSSSEVVSLEAYRLVEESVAGPESTRLVEWPDLLAHGAGVGELRLVGPNNSHIDVMALIVRDDTGWRITIHRLARPAQESGVVRDLPAVLAAWRAAERRLEATGNADPSLSEEARRLAEQYRLLAKAARWSPSGGTREG